MPKLRKIFGNYKEILANIYPGQPGVVDAFVGESTDLVNDLIKDLGRQKFVSTNGRTYEEHVATWMAPSVSKSYSQGNMTAGFFQLALMQFIVDSPKFLQQKQREGILPRTEENRINRYGREREHLSLAYYDDNGAHCGVTITYSTLDPTLWNAVIIRNTDSAPADRQVLFISPEDIISPEEAIQGAKARATAKEKTLTSVSDAANTFLNFLQSKQLKEALRGAFLEDGTINRTLLGELNTQYVIELTEEQREHNALKLKQMDAVKKWKLTPDQFAVLKLALEAKQKTNLQKAQEWFEQWKVTSGAELVRNNQESIQQEMAEQSFLKTHGTSITIIVLAVLVLIALILTLTGVLAPFGIALGAGTATFAGMGGAGAAGAVAVGTGVKVALDENERSTHQAQLATELEKTPEVLENIYQAKRQEIGTAINIANDAEQITRAVIAANFSKEEFEELEKAIAEAVPVIVQQPKDLASSQEDVVDLSHSHSDDFSAVMHSVDDLGQRSELEQRAVQAVNLVPSSLPLSSIPTTVVTTKENTVVESSEVTVTHRVDATF